MMRSLEKEILDKALYIEALQQDHRKVNKLHSSSEKDAFVLFPISDSWR